MIIDNWLMEEDPRIVKFTAKHFLQEKVLSDKCIDMLITMHNQFHFQIIAVRQAVQKSLAEYDKQGKPLKQRDDTQAIREHGWQCQSYPKNL